MIIISNTISIIFFRFFHNLDWEDVYNKLLKPPIVPNMISDEDTSNFEDYTEEDSKKGTDVPQKYFKLFEDF